MSQFRLIVPGGLNTDIVGLGVDHLLSTGELTLGGKLYIGPGGKSRNMAQMAAAFLGPEQVAMIGKTSKDPFGFWKIPIEALEKAGVDTTNIIKLDFNKAGGKYPGIALIPVDKNGKNQIYVLPGINADFSSDDLDKANKLFTQSIDNQIMLLSLEISLDTVRYAIQKAYKNKIRIILDPGGITESIEDILNEKIYILKPNEHEVEFLTGIKISDFESARLSARKLLDKRIHYILITHGAKGGYLFGKELSVHIPVPPIKKSGKVDETGCGDQVTAILAACLSKNLDIIQSTKLAILAGTMQYYREGIQPVNERELLESFDFCESLYP